MKTFTGFYFIKHEYKLEYNKKILEQIANCSYKITHFFFIHNYPQFLMLELRSGMCAVLMGFSGCSGSKCSSGAGYTIQGKVK